MNLKKITFIVGIIFTMLAIRAIAQDHNTKNSFAAEGYDVVSYFDNKVEKGNSDFQTKYEGIDYRFSNKQNLEKFKLKPENYVPQYGGWCAYAMGLNGEKVSINPNTFEIREGKLYLFYNKLGTNTFDLWIKEDPIKLKKAADINWSKSK